jgi:hypothetical protein
MVHLTFLGLFNEDRKSDPTYTANNWANKEFFLKIKLRENKLNYDLIE